MPIFSAFAKQAYRAGLREAQDVLMGCDDVDQINLEATGRFRLQEEWMARLLYRDISRKLVTMNPGIRPVQLTRNYELFLLVCPQWRDTWYANAINGWRDRCRTSVCWIDELWTNEMPKLEYWLPILSQFDHVIVGVSGSGKALSDRIGRPVHEIIGGVDTIRFCPFPNPPARAIDFLSIGRRRESIHEVLLKFTTTHGLFYLRDTLARQADTVTPDYREHREMYAQKVKRSRFFLVAPGKMDLLEQTGGQVDIGFRYFEGAAAGAVLLGQAPNSELFHQRFDWPEAIVEMHPDGSDAVQVITRLLAEPDRVQEISRRNVWESLRRHDWIYRWKEVLKIAGLEPAPGMEIREKHLRDLADMASGQCQ